MVDYQSDAIYEIKKLEVEYLTIPETGQSFQATIYVPIPKPCLLYTSDAADE